MAKDPPTRRTSVRAGLVLGLGLFGAALGLAAALWGFALGNVAVSFGQEDAFSAWVIYSSLPAGVLNLAALGAASSLAKGARWAFWLTLATAVLGLVALYWWYVPAAILQGLAVVLGAPRPRTATPRAFTAPSSKT